MRRMVRWKKGGSNENTEERNVSFLNLGTLASMLR